MTVAASLFAGCAPAPPSAHVVPPPATTVPPSLPAPSTATAPPGAAAVEDVVLVTDPIVLKEIEARGGSLHALVDGTPSPGPRYAAIVASIRADVAAAKASDPQSGTGLGSSHRLFDASKLGSKEAKFELVAVSNRIDRLHVAPSACGEVRFVYRLSYATTRSGVAITSRLPATLAVSFWSRDKESAGDCRAVAARWQKPADKEMTAWLLARDGPLGPLDAIRPRFKSVELNLQLVRWPSTVRPDLGGHAEYLLRAFVDRGGVLVPGPLENTPDVAKLKHDPALRAKLVRWLSDEKNLARVDAGTAILPDELLATRAISVSPRGLARRANRPFRQIFDPATVAAFDPKPQSRRHAKSPAALLRRLDALSCQGCHQSRSIAGFHLLGEEPTRTASANALASGLSPHLAVDLARRKRRLRALDDDDVPLAERGDDEPGRYGAHCGRGDPGFASWTCARGLVCAPDDENPDDADVGVCLPETPEVGDPCEAGVIAPNADAHLDRVAKVVPRSCAPSFACERNAVGFPGGMCQASCAEPTAHGVCTGIPILVGFNDCLAKKVPFEQCIADHTSPGAVRACDASTPCRDDYVCARTAKGGACMPPYFLFQLRVDGHP